MCLLHRALTVLRRVFSSCRRDAETQPVTPVALLDLKRVDVQRGGARTGVDLGLDLRNAEIGQRQPLPPADDDEPAKPIETKAVSQEKTNVT